MWASWRLSVLRAATDDGQPFGNYAAAVADAEWRDDPVVPGRKRAFKDGQWLGYVHDSSGQYEEPYLAQYPRWQYGVVAIGMFGAFERLRNTLGVLGADGWELVTVYDKASNWLNGMEHGFMLFKRPVPAGQKLPDEQWVIAVNLDS